jgi:stage II sporulation protein R
MKKICIIFLTLIIISVTALGLSGIFSENTQNGGGRYEANLSKTDNEYLRIHIRADSNEPQAQAVKYRVRDEIVKSLTPLVAEYKTQAQAINGVGKHLSEIEKTAICVLREQGCSYGATAELTVEKFPTRVYGEYILPAGEYAAISMVSAGAGYVEMALMILVANARYFLMSCTMSQRFSPTTPFYHRLLVGFDLTDEIFAINVARDSYLQPAYAYGAISIAIPGWALGTGLGVVMGNVLPDFAVSALSTALFGMFIAIIIPPATKNRTIAVLVALGFTLSTLADRLPCLDFVSSGVKTIILTIVISLGAAIIRPIPSDEDCE